MGAWEGLNSEGIQAYNIKEWEYIRADPISRAPAGGENYAQLHERATRALRHCRESYAGQSVLWATHSELIGVTLCSALRVDLSYRRCFRRDNASVTELQFDCTLPVIMRLNDISHLGGELRGIGNYS